MTAKSITGIGALVKDNSMRDQFGGTADILIENGTETGVVANNLVSKSKAAYPIGLEERSGEGDAPGEGERGYGRMHETGEMIQ